MGVVKQKLEPKYVEKKQQTDEHWRPMWCLPAPVHMWSFSGISDFRLTQFPHTVREEEIPCLFHVFPFYSPTNSNINCRSWSDSSIQKFLADLLAVGDIFLETVFGISSYCSEKFSFLPNLSSHFVDNFLFFLQSLIVFSSVIFILGIRSLLRTAN